MALSRNQRATTIILDAETDRLLDVAAQEAGTSRSEFIRMQLRRVLLQYMEHPKPRSDEMGHFAGEWAEVPRLSTIPSPAR
jgi:metal-responsive CopG/Arc/MetJ family transcriptional regulator